MAVYFAIVISEVLIQTVHTLNGLTNFEQSLTESSSETDGAARLLFFRLSPQR